MQKCAEQNFFFLSLQDAASSDEEADTGKDADAGEVRLNKRHLDDAADYEGEEDEKNVIEVEV